MIQDQKAHPYSILKIGSAGTGAKNGCGPFAVYNALYLLSEENTKPNLTHIIRDLEEMGAFILGGRLGTNPQAIIKYLRRMPGYQTDYRYLPKNMDEQIKQSSVSILLFIGSIKKVRVHYVTIRHEQGNYLIYNLAPRAILPYATTSIDAWVNDTSYIPVMLTSLQTSSHGQINF